MAERDTRSIARVVVLAPDAAAVCWELRQVRQANLRCVGVGSAYEAAAELLAEPAVALVADLRCLCRRHLRLLSIARQGRLEVLGFGALPRDLTAEDLSGVRLVSRQDLPAALERASRAVAASPAASAPAEAPIVQPGAPVALRPAKRSPKPPPASSAPQRAGDFQPAGPSAPGAKQPVRLDAAPPRKTPEEMLEDLDRRPPERAQPGPVPAPGRAAPGDILTVEELEALLSDEADE